MKNLRDDNQYKDIIADGLDGVAVERLPRVASRKFIKTRPEFESLPSDDQRIYWHSLASALNCALDTMQQERNSLLSSCARQEKQIEALQNQSAKLTEALQVNISAMNIKQNDRAEELHNLKREHIRDLQNLKTEIKNLKS